MARVIFLCQVQNLFISKRINVNLSIYIEEIKNPFIWAVQSAPLRKKDCLIHFFSQSLFQTLIPVFLQRTVVQSRASFNSRNQYFKIIHLFVSHNRSKLFGLGRRLFHKEKRRRQSPVRAHPFIYVFHLYKQSSSDNRVALGMEHAANF